MAQQQYTITGFVIDEDTYDFKDTTTGNATITEAGFMSASDKASLDDVVLAIANMYTKAQTDALIAQSTADAAKSYDIIGTAWADVYNTLSKLAASRPAVVSIAGGTASLMTGGKTAYACTGIAKVVNPTTGVYEFMVMSNTSQYIYTWRITGLTSASSTPTISTVYRFSGTAV